MILRPLSPRCLSRSPAFTRRTLSAPAHSLARPSRVQTYARRSAYALAALGAAYLADRELYASTVARNLRTFWTVRRRSLYPTSLDAHDSAASAR